MKRAKRRKQTSLKIKHVDFKRINDIFSGVSKGRLRFKFISIFLLAAFCASSAVDVVWEAKLPAVFGNITYLECNISDAAVDCLKKTRQWFGGPEHRSLCYNNNCTVSNKYEVMKQSSCLYTLMIHNFSEFDVNCDYTCTYGVSRMRQNLTLDGKRFIYEPHDTDIIEKSIVKDKTLDWRINITKVFPKPSCGADLNGENITDHLKISDTKPGFYFASDLRINIPLSSCGKLDVYCHLGDYKVNITSKNFEKCKGGKSSGNENDVVLIVSIIVSVLVVMIIIVSVCIVSRHNGCKGDQCRKGVYCQVR
ncbi:uncharacterized protein [Mytilus edulis]|uniref:uncharacterized protein n=1 Tax=Mytilus edulis TaxID=6550 RepID=UPI0039F0AFA0